MLYPYPGSLSVTIGARSAASTPSFVACDRIAVLVLLPPQLDLILLGALDAPLAHLDIVLDLSLRELTVLPEDDVETQAEHTQADKYYCCQ